MGNCFNGCNQSIIWIILLLALCNGNGCGCGSDSCGDILPIILLLLCCCGNSSPCDNVRGDRCGCGC